MNESLIILYDKFERDFTTAGIGILKDAISCVVTEELNGSYELEMDYPITGAHYSDIKEDYIILAKANDDANYQPQPFRIYKITRPIDGTVAIYASHISYDMIKIPVKKIDAESLEDLVTKIQNSKMVQGDPFTFTSTKSVSDTKTSFKTKVPYNLRSLLLGDDSSVAEVYGGDFIFDRYNVILTDRRGTDKDFTIRYSKNMLDLEQETSTDLMYNAIHPYYSSTNTETKNGISQKYKEIHLSKDAKGIQPKQDPITDEYIYPSNWLSYNENGAGLDLILTTSVTNIIVTEGDFKDHLVHAKKVTPKGETEEGTYYYDVTYVKSYINTNYTDEFGEYWLCTDPSDMDRTPIIPQEWNPNNLPTKDPKDGSDWWNPELNKNKIYRIYTTGDKLYKLYIYKYDTVTGKYKYQAVTSDDNIESYAPLMPTTYSESEEKDNTILYEGDFVYVDEIRAMPKEGEQPFSSKWLQKIEEQEQYSTKDDRFKKGEDIIPESNKIYKVPTKEEPKRAYAIHKLNNKDVEKYSRDWLSETEDNQVPLVPEDCKSYIVKNDYEEYKDKPSYGKDFIFRWSDYDKKYSQITDTRFTYKNYEWNGTSYVEHQTTNDGILVANLTDRFSDQPKNTALFQKKLYDEAVKYIKENRIGQLKDTIKVTFIKLSSSNEYANWKQLEQVLLGDTVHVIYEDLGLNDVIKKVIKTEYNVLSQSYDSIELGEKGNNFTNDAVVVGDNISALTNDRSFADTTYVNKLVAKSVEAEKLKAANAVITEAQINSLTADSVKAQLVQAERFEIDRLVSILLVSDDAAIKNTLRVGKGIEMAGNINIKGGSIKISNATAVDHAIKAYINPNYQNDHGYDWLVLNKDDTEALVPTSTDIYDVYDEDEVSHGYFKYTTDNYVEFDSEEESSFEVDNQGNVTINSGQINLGLNKETGEYNFNVTNDGVVSAKQITITSGFIQSSSGMLDGIDTLKADTIEAESIKNVDNLSAKDINVSDSLNISGLSITSYAEYEEKYSAILGDGTVTIKNVEKKENQNDAQYIHTIEFNITLRAYNDDHVPIDEVLAGLKSDIKGYIEARLLLAKKDNKEDKTELIFARSNYHNPPLEVTIKKGGDNIVTCTYIFISDSEYYFWAPTINVVYFNIPTSSTRGILYDHALSEKKIKLDAPTIIENAYIDNAYVKHVLGGVESNPYIYASIVEVTGKFIAEYSYPDKDYNDVETIDNWYFLTNEKIAEIVDSYEIKSVQLTPYYPNANRCENPGVCWGHYIHMRKSVKGIYISDAGSEGESSKWCITIYYTNKGE